MTESEFETQLLTLSTKIANLIGQPGGNAAKSNLGALAMTTTSTADLDSAFAALTAGPEKLSAFENQFAREVAAAGVPPITSGLVSQTAQPTIVTLAAPTAPTPASPAPIGAPPAALSAASPRGYMWVGPIISFAIITGFFMMLTVLLWQQQHPLGMLTATPVAASAGDVAPPTSTNASGLQNVLFTLLGALGAAFTQVVNFWLGSSKGSSDKTDLIATAVAAQTQSQQ